MRILAGLLLIGISLQAAAVEIIANPGVTSNSLPEAAARALFGMRLTRWPDGRLVRVFVLPDTHPAHVALCKEQLNLYPYQLRQAWDRLIYSGTAQAPIEVATEDEMISRVAATPGALGYVRKVKPNDLVKTLGVQ